VWNHTNLREEPLDHALGRSRGGLSTKIHQLCDRHGRHWWSCSAPDRHTTHPCAATCWPGCEFPVSGPADRAPPRPRRSPTGPIRPGPHVNCCAPGGSPPSSPERRDQIEGRRRRGTKGGRPVSYDPIAYKGRNVVERSFNAFNNWRGIATRYDALTYRGAAVLAAIVIWLGHLGHTP
jgi:hypothetical protein